MTLDVQVAGLQLRHGAVTALDDLSLTLPGSLAICLAGPLPGAAVTWALVRDIPIRNRLA
jgi:hypothetical protein